MCVACAIVIELQISPYAGGESARYRMAGLVNIMLISYLDDLIQQEEKRAGEWLWIVEEFQFHLKFPGHYLCKVCLVNVGKFLVSFVSCNPWCCPYSFV